MKNMKLKLRLMGGFGLLLAGMAVLGFISLGGLRQIQGYSQRIVVDSLPGVYNIGALKSLLQTNLSALEEILRAEDPVARAAIVEKVNGRTGKVNDTFKTYEA